MRTLIFLLITFCVKSFSWPSMAFEDPCELNDPCFLPNGLPGVVKKDRDCEFAIKLFTKKRDEFLKLVCGREVTSQLVCCLTKTKAQLACEAFGKRPDKPPLVNDHILNGKDADLGEFPHFASLAYENENKVTFACGGVLISENFVLTAAHCVKKSSNLRFVRLGKTTLNDTDPEDFFEKVEFGIKSVTSHPSYNTSLKDHDIALIELNETVKFKYNVFPACIGDLNETKLIISGFGRYDIRNQKTPKWMLTAEVNETSVEECRERYKKIHGENLSKALKLKNGITENILCAGSKAADTCNGDSGSGIMKVEKKLRNPSTRSLLYDKTFYVVGITSYGIGCGSLSFYTRVSEYVKWIEEIVWP